MRAPPNHIQTLLITVAAAMVLGFAFGAYAQGDGSATNNPDLLRGSFSPFCERAMLCHPSNQAAPTQVPVQAATQAMEKAPGPGSAPVADTPVLYHPQPHGYGLAVAPVVPDSAWTFGYGVSLRGRYVASADDQRFDVLATPRASWRYEGSQRQTGIAAEIGMVQPHDGDGRIESANIALDSVMAIGPLTRFALDGDLALSQPDPRDIDATPQGAMTAPLDFTGQVNTGLSHQMGRAMGTVTAGIGRSVSFDGSAEDGGPISGANPDSTTVSAGLRLGHEITPIVSVFGQADVARSQFDRTALDNGPGLDGWTNGLRAGVMGNWQDVLTGEASIGYGWQDFDAGDLTGARSVLYGLAVGFAPDPTMSLRLAFDTGIGAGRDGQIAQIDYDLSLAGQYTVNSWLGLRASSAAGWRYDPQGQWLETRLLAGLGSDIVLGPHSTLEFDYAYGLREQAGSERGLRDEHRLSAGVTLQY